MSATTPTINSSEKLTLTLHDRCSLVLLFRDEVTRDLADWLCADVVARSHTESDKSRHRASERSLDAKGARDIVSVRAQAAFISHTSLCELRRPKPRQEEQMPMECKALRRSMPTIHSFNETGLYGVEEH